MAGDDRSVAIATLIIVADFIMIIFGFIGETAINTSSGGGFNLIGWAIYPLGYIITVVLKPAKHSRMARANL